MSSSRRFARATSRSRSPPTSGPSGVSIAARRPAITVARSPMSTGRRARAAPTVRASSASRSGAAKSVASKTVCTNVPNSVPPGPAARIGATPSSAASGGSGDAASGSVKRGVAAGAGSGGAGGDAEEAGSGSVKRGAGSAGGGGGASASSGEDAVVPAGRRRRGGRNERRRGRRSRVVGLGLVVDDGLLRLAGHSRLVRAGGDVAVGGAAPVAVELAVPRGGAQQRCGVWRARPCDREAEPRGAFDGHAPGGVGRELLEAGERGVVARDLLALAATLPSASRANRRRESAASRLPQEPAHQITA